MLKNNALGSFSFIHSKLLRFFVSPALQLLSTKYVHMYELYLESHFFHLHLNYILRTKHLLEIHFNSIIYLKSYKINMKFSD